MYVVCPMNSVGHEANVGLKYRSVNENPIMNSNRCTHAASFPSRLCASAKNGFYGHKMQSFNAYY